jgi:hypothetical protein
MRKLTYYFNEMSKYAAREEQLGELEKAQQTRDTRNTSWAEGVRVETRYQQSLDRLKRFQR